MAARWSGNRVARLVDNGRPASARGGLVEPPLGAEPHRRVRRVSRVLSGPFRAIAARSLDDRVGINSGLGRLGESSAGCAFADAARVRGPKARKHITGTLLFIRRVFTWRVGLKKLGRRRESNLRWFFQMVSKMVQVSGLTFSVSGLTFSLFGTVSGLTYSGFQ